VIDGGAVADFYGWLELIDWLEHASLAAVKGDTPDLDNQEGKASV
jgi:hypothetical protein